MSVYHDWNLYNEALNNYVNTPGKVVNGLGYYVVQGRLVSDKEFWEHNSRPVFQYPPRQNSDKTNISPEIKTKKRK